MAAAPALFSELGETEPVAPPTVLLLCSLGGTGGAPDIFKLFMAGNSTVSDSDEDGGDGLSIRLRDLCCS